MYHHVSSVSLDGLFILRTLVDGVGYLHFASLLAIIKHPMCMVCIMFNFVSMDEFSLLQCSLFKSGMYLWSISFMFGAGDPPNGLPANMRRECLIS